MFRNQPSITLSTSRPFGLRWNQPRIFLIAWGPANPPLRLAEMPWLPPCQQKETSKTWLSMSCLSSSCKEETNFSQEFRVGSPTPPWQTLKKWTFPLTHDSTFIFLLFEDFTIGNTKPYQEAKPKRVFKMFSTYKHTGVASKHTQRHPSKGIPNGTVCLETRAGQQVANFVSWLLSEQYQKGGGFVCFKHNEFWNLSGVFYFVGIIS